MNELLDFNESPTHFTFPDVMYMSNKGVKQSPRYFMYLDVKYRDNKDVAFLALDILWKQRALIDWQMKVMIGDKYVVNHWMMIHSMIDDIFRHMTDRLRTDYDMLHTCACRYLPRSFVPDNLRKIKNLREWLRTQLQVKNGNGLFLYLGDGDVSFSYLN